MNPESLKSKLCLASDKIESRVEAEFNRDPCDSPLICNLRLHWLVTDEKAACMQ